MGIGKEELWKNVLLNNSQPVKEMNRLDVGKNDSFYVYRLKRNDYRELNRIYAADNKKESKDFLFLATAAKLALVDSKLSKEIIYKDTVLIVSHESPELGNFYDLIINETYKTKFKNKKISKANYTKYLYSNLSKSAYNLQSFMFLFRIAKYLNIHGFTQYINNACASGLYGIESASQHIKLNKCKAALVVAGDHPDFYKYLWFKRIGLYSPNGQLRPFDANSNGFVFGEGAVGIVFEDLEHARKRKATIYGEYLGGGFSQDCWKVSFPAIKEKHYENAFVQALAISKIKKKDVDLIVPHGVGNYIIDRFEAEVIKNIYIEHRLPLISAFKPYFGHNLGGSALLETALLLLAIKNRQVPATLNIKQKHPRINLDLVDRNTRKKINCAVKMACGFAGYNAVAVFKRL